MMLALALSGLLAAAPSADGLLRQTGGQSLQLVTPDDAPLTGAQALFVSGAATAVTLGVSGYGLFLRQTDKPLGNVILGTGLLLLQLAPSLSHLIQGDPGSLYLFSGIQMFFAVGALVALVPFGPVFAGMFGAMWLGSVFFNFLEVGDSAADWAGRENARRRSGFEVSVTPTSLAVRF